MLEVVEQFSWWSALDIAIVACCIYFLLSLVQGTRASEVLTGVLVLIGAFLLSSALPLTVVNWAMNKFYSSILIILVILFQDDVRRALARIGNRSLIRNTTPDSDEIVEVIAATAFALARRGLGAIMVFERHILLTRYVDIGTLVDGKVSKELLLSLFVTQAPTHDGAVILRKGRLAAAGCFLPLTRQENLSPHFGSRHRAALGISQETDALVVLVSEEQRRVTLVEDGDLLPADSEAQLVDALRARIRHGNRGFSDVALRKSLN